MTDADDKPPIDEDELLAILKAERARAIGFENDGTLTSDRQRALEYKRGVMTDMPSLENRSAATTTDIADAIRTMLPDLMDMFTGGDDVMTFVAHGPEDEQAAKQETDYLKNVIFQQNDGFWMLYSMIDDALSSKVGVVTWYWEEYDAEEETLEGKTREELIGIRQQANPPPLQPGAPPPPPRFEIVSEDAGEEPDTFDIVIKKPNRGRLCVKPIAPEDIAVAPDTIRLPDATYASWRSRQRMQQLIADGFDPEQVRALSPYGSPQDDATRMARDTAGESTNSMSLDNSVGDLREVEVFKHYLRLPSAGGKRLEVWCFTTGAGETVLLDSKKVGRVEMAAVTPFPMPHRFYGESVADLLMSHQRQSTAVLRAWFDSMYFALNQRAEISETKSNENTVSDFLRNEPGVPVRSKTGDAVRPIEAGALNIDMLASLEYLATVAEKKTGVVRATQGLNPDTLHDTAKGALALMSASLRRMRLIGRIFAETGLKDLFLGAHATLRENSTRADQIRLNGTWVQIDPSSWGERADMEVEIGLGSGGKDQAIAMLLQQIDAMSKVIEIQGGMDGPVITAANVYELAKKFFEVTGSKQPELYVTDPKTAPPKEPQPDPKMVEAQAKAQEAQQQLQLDAQRAEAEFNLQQQKDAGQLKLAQDKASFELNSKRDLAALELQHKRDLAGEELNLKRQIAAVELQMKQDIAAEELRQQEAMAERQHALAERSATRDANRRDAETDSKIEAQVRVGGDPG